MPPAAAIRRPFRRPRTPHRAAATITALLTLGLPMLGSAAVPPSPRTHAAHAAAVNVAAAAAVAARLDFEVHGYEIGIETAFLTAPEARLLDAAGQRMLVAAVAPVRVDNIDQPGRWTASVRANPQDPLVIEPGQTIEVAFGQTVTRVAVPNVTAELTADALAVTGQAPTPGKVEVSFVDGYQSMRNEVSFLDGYQTVRNVPPPATAARSATEGRFRLILSPAMDVGPGVIGTATYVHPDGHRIARTFGRPGVLLDFDRGVAQAFAPYSPRLTIRVGDAIGERWRSAPAAWSGSGRHYTPLLEQVGDVRYVLDAVPGQRVSLWDGDVQVADAPFGVLRARLVPEYGMIAGHTVPGAKVRATVTGQAQPVIPFIHAKEDGTFSTYGLTRGEHGRMFGRVQSFPSGAFAYEAPLIVPSERVDLYGSGAGISAESDGEITGWYTSADGTRAFTRLLPHQRHLPNEMQLRFDWYDANGRPAVIAPGDRLAFQPLDGTTVTLQVPDIDLRVAPDGQTLLGHGPPGSVLAGVRYGRAGDVLAPVNLPFPDQEGKLAGITGKIGPDGTFELPCEDVCPSPLGRVTIKPPWKDVPSGRATYSVVFFAPALSGAAPSLGLVRGFATAGAHVTAELLAADGTATAHREAIATFDTATRPARWSIDFSDRFPHGIPTGTRFRIAVDADAVDLDVPVVTHEPDVLADGVAGTAPAGWAVEAWALPNLAIDAARAPTKAVAMVAADGRWRVTFDGYNLRAEDDVTLTFRPPDAPVFYQYDLGHLAGPPEATAGPTPTASTTPPPTATRAATTEPTPPAIAAGRTLYLPVARRDGP